MRERTYGQLSDILVSCKYLNEEGKICEILNEDMRFSYRHSIFIDNPKLVILEAKFKLYKDTFDNIDCKMKQYNLSRRTKQPLEYPNSGSVFRRPEGYFVGKLVQDCNLRGVNVGGAYVSEKHTGFIVNKGNATCQDIQKLIELIQKTVFEKFNVNLKTEVEFIGRF